MTTRSTIATALTSLALSFAVGCGAATSDATGESSSTGDTLGATIPGGSTTGDEATGAVKAAASGASAASASLVPDVKLPYRGINLSGGEFGEALPGILGRDYKWPTTDEVDYFMAKGMNTFRVGFKWERMQPVANGDFNAVYFAGLEDVVDYATSKGAHVVLNPHNYAHYYGVQVGTAIVPNSVFANFWSRMATKFKNNPLVIFNLTNEPHDIPTEQWVNAANAAIAAIRQVGATNLIHVPGNGWTGAHSWSSSYYGTPNSVAMLKITDPSDNYMFEVHQYLDASSGGQSQTCTSKTIASQRMKGFIDWLRANKKRGFLGEFAGGNNDTCNAAVKDMLTTLEDASDVMQGWLWWAAGPMWKNYGFSLEPVSGKDGAQMALLDPTLAALKAATAR